jgi:hypothetical protein
LTEVHVGLVERFIHTTKERVRCVVSVQPFKHYPFVMVKEAVAAAFFWLNVFPPVGGISKTLGPQTIIMGSRIDYKKHCQMEYGQYVETHEPHTNNMKERTCPAIFLRTNGNEHGGAFFMSLRTGQRLNRTAWTILPMPDGVIDTVHRLAQTDTEGIPFQNRQRQEYAEIEAEPTQFQSAGVINENDIGNNTDEETDDESDNDDDDDDNDDDMPGLQDRDPYDSDSDDEDDDG